MPYITSPTFKADPFPYYAQLRRQSPVHEVMLPGRQRAWLVKRYSDVLALLKDERFVKSPANMVAPGKSAFPYLRLTTEPLRWRRGLVLRGLEGLGVGFAEC